MNDPRLTIPFADEAGDGEAHWIRLEQVALPDEGVTMAEAAELVDELYGIDACEDGLGAGGEEADGEDLPEEEEFLELARERLDLEICDDESAEATWETEVDVFSSHQEDGYSLQGERVEVGATTPMSKAVTETAEMNGASYDLQWPYGGGISVSAGEVLEVKGSTVNFKAPVKGRVRIRYTAVWDRVALKVGKGAADTGGPALAGVLVVSGGAAKTNSREEDNASVVAFWRNLAAECSLTRPPEDDQEIDAAEIERLCNRETDWHVAGECWQTIETYNLCKCSGREAPDAPEPVDEDAPCPEGVRPGSWLGTVRRMGEYVDCPGEDDEGLNTPEFFKEHCCEDRQYSPLPRCRETREPHRGGKEIEHGPEHWKGIYGESVRLTAVTPEGGNCGELVKVWAVPQEIEGPPVLPDELFVEPGSNFSVTVTVGGRPPFTWIPPEGVEQVGTAAYGFMGLFRADPAFRGGPLSVVDACGRSAMCALITETCFWVDACRRYRPACATRSQYIRQSSDFLPDAPYGFNDELYCRWIPENMTVPGVGLDSFGKPLRTASCDDYKNRNFQDKAPPHLFSSSGKYMMLCWMTHVEPDDAYFDYLEKCFERSIDEIIAYAERYGEYLDLEECENRRRTHIMDARDVLTPEAANVLANGEENPGNETWISCRGRYYVYEGEAPLGLHIHDLSELVCE